MWKVTLALSWDGTIQSDAIRVDIKMPRSAFNAYPKLLLQHGDPVAGRR